MQQIDFDTYYATDKMLGGPVVQTVEVPGPEKFVPEVSEVASPVAVISRLLVYLLLTAVVVYFMISLH